MNTRKKAFVIAFVLVAASVFSAGKKDGDPVLSFAGSGGYPPFNFMDSSGKVVGFDVDIAAEIAARLGRALDYRTTAWDGIIEGLRASRYDGILGSMAITDKRLKIVDFSSPYYYSGPQLIVRKDSSIAGVESLNAESTIGLVTGTTFELDAERTGAKIRLYEDDNQTLLELINGRLDGVLTDRIVGLNAIGKMKGGDQLVLAGSVLRSEEMGVAFNKKDKALLQKVNAALEAMRKDGTLKAISEKWFNGADITVK